MAEEDRDLIDDVERPQPPGGSRPRGPGVSRRSFLTGAAAGAAGGAVITGGVIGVAGGSFPAQVGTAPVPEPMESRVLTLNVNGKDNRLVVRANETLLEVLRQDLGLTGTKLGCNYSECSACTVISDGIAVNACSVLAIRESGKKIVTIEGLEKDGKLHPVQQAFWDRMGFQCGFCTPGQIMRSVALLNHNPNPSEDVIRHEMSGNLCKCAAYPYIMAAIKDASAKMRSA